MGWENFTISIEIADYLGNRMIYTHGCYATLMGSHRWRLDPCRFRWPWV